MDIEEYIDSIQVKKGETHSSKNKSNLFRYKAEQREGALQCEMKVVKLFDRSVRLPTSFVNIVASWRYY